MHVKSYALKLTRRALFEYPQLLRIHICRLPVKWQGKPWRDGLTGRMRVIWFRSVYRCCAKSNHLLVGSSPGNTATVTDPVQAHVLVVLDLVLCFRLAFARFAAFCLAFFKNSRDQLTHRHIENNNSLSVQGMEKMYIVNSVGVAGPFLRAIIIAIIRVKSCHTAVSFGVKQLQKKGETAVRWQRQRQRQKYIRNSVRSQDNATAAMPAPAALARTNAMRVAKCTYNGIFIEQMT